MHCFGPPVGIAGNLIKYFIHYSHFKLSHKDLLSVHCKLTWNALPYKWSFHPSHYFSWHTLHKAILHKISPYPWFWRFGLLSHLIFAFSCLRLRHNFLPNHSSPMCTVYFNEILCDLYHIIFDCPTLSSLT